MRILPSANDCRRRIRTDSGFFGGILRPLVTLLRYMGLRKNITLKLLSILLFTFGLVAPVVASASPSELEASAGLHLALSAPTHHSSVTQLLFEETSGEEERIAKDHKPQYSFAPYTLLEPGVIDLVSFGRGDGYNSCPIQKLRAHPSLFRLYRTILI